MDYLFSVLIPISEIKKTKIVEIMAKWGGDEFSRNPREFTYENALDFHEITDLNYFQKIIGKGFDVCNCIALYLEGNQIQTLVALAHTQALNILDNKLVLFIFELFNTLNTFCITIEIEDECTNNIYFVSNAQEAIKIIIGSLIGTSSKGIIIVKKIDECCGQLLL